MAKLMAHMVELYLPDWNAERIESHGWEEALEQVLVLLRDAVKDCLRASQMRVSETESAFTKHYMASRRLNRHIEAALGRQEV